MRDLQTVAQDYPFGRFLGQRWWFLLLAVPKLYRTLAYGAASFLAAGAIFAAILGAWYLFVLVMRLPEPDEGSTG